MDKLRVFVAIDMPRDVRMELAEAQRFLRKQSLFEGTYTDAVQAHMTLQFLGNIREQELPEVHKALQTLEQPSYEAVTNGLNFFDRGGRVSVIFMLISCPQLIPFIEELRQLLAPWHTPDEHQFIPHVTLARVHHAQDHEKLMRIVTSYDVPQVSFRIERFALKKSVLGGEGPIHTTLYLYRMKPSD